MFKYYFTKIVRWLSTLLYIFPVKENRILFYSFSGKGYSDSPKYISEFLEKMDKNYELIWAVNNPNDCLYAKEHRIKLIKYSSFQHAYFGLTSKFIVTNTGPYKALKYRNSQFIINTWHGGGAYKKTGIDNPYKNKWQVLYNKKFGQAGVKLFLSSSEFFTKYAIRGAFEYNGEVLSCGLPRNDILLDLNQHNKICDAVKKTLEIAPDKKLVLYAPTWRNYEVSNYEKIIPEQVVKACSKRFSGDWVFVYRGHNLSKGLDYKSESIICVDATSYPDMQELMIAADVLISDYSSCIWDYSLLFKPCFLFVPDLDQYDKTFAFYTDIKTWGFDVCVTNDALIGCIVSYDEKISRKAIEENHAYFGNEETGFATDFLYKYIKNK